MQLFADLLDALSYQPARNGKLRLIEDYLRHAPDPDRGYALAALCGELDLPGLKPAALREMTIARVDPELFGWSYDYVGDLAETIALIWPAADKASHPPPRLSDVIERLRLSARAEAMMLMAGWLDGLDATGRWALLKLAAGALRVGVSARLAKTALSAIGSVGLQEIEEIWPQHEPPYAELIGWVAGGEKPATRNTLGFRPLMLSHPIEDSEFANLPPHDFRAEWKWDGIRVQVAAGGGEARLYSRAGEDVTGAFPDLIDAVDFDAVLDGELLVARPGVAGIDIAPFNDLQQRLNRKKPSAALLLSNPAHVRLYDALTIGAEDLRMLPLRERRRRLESWYSERARPRFDLSPLILFADWSELARLRTDARAQGIEGLMLKRWESPYIAGRVKGHWFKWKRDALTIDAVLMYAQRGHGKRSSFYSDFTFGCWRPTVDETGADGRELVPVGKAYSGFTDEELKKLDRWVRNNTVERFGPVRVLSPALVAEFEFDSVHQSTRHKSGLALRFPRFHRIRWDKPAAEADEVETLKKLMA
ncbi:MAG: cisplatin damage response ATP-dependent DNA ligase [Dongiaceae bacterium]